MIETERNILDELKGRQPFRVPEGYFEGFTDDFMRRLAPEAKVISLYDRVKPWLYLAATFAGIIILFNIYNNKSAEMVKDGTAIHVAIEDEEEDEDFIDFIFELYAMSSIDYDDYLFDN